MWIIILVVGHSCVAFVVKHSRANLGWRTTPACIQGSVHLNVENVEPDFHREQHWIITLKVDILGKITVHVGVVANYLDPLLVIITICGCTQYVIQPQSTTMLLL
jgi:hypothetical protein